MLVTTTPKAVTPEILAFCLEIDATTRPLYVPVRPALLAIPSNCFINVREEVAHGGGGLQHGWIIWERPGWFLEAEFHAVWISPEGSLIDITPLVDGEESILFLPDSRRTFQGEVAPNRMRPLSDRREVRRLVEVAAEVSRVAASMRTAAFRAKQGQPRNVGRNQPCTCGSGLKFKRCCARKPG